MVELLAPQTQNKTVHRCQSCSRSKDKLVWIEARYGEGVIGGYVCLKCVQSLEDDRSISNFTVDWEDVKP